MKLAYLILGHAHPEQIVRMIERLRPSGSAFVVHIDQRSPAAVSEAMERYAAKVQDVFLAPRHKCYWGSYGIVQGTLACIRTLLAQRIDFDYAALVSGQDYPVKSAAEMAAFFAARPGVEFIEAFSLVKPNRWTAHEGRFQAMERVMRYTFWLRSRPISMLFKRKFYADWEPHGGSQWWCLTRGAVEWVDAYVRANPGVKDYFAHSFIPDESMIQSMVANSPFRDRISAETLTHIDWDRPNPRYPRTMDLEDEAMDLQAARESGKLFARKVDPERSLGWMDRVDELVRAEDGLGS